MDKTDDYLHKFSSYNKLLRITALILRFKHNCQSYKTLRRTGPLTTRELYDSRIRIISLIQLDTFETEINLLKKEKSLPINSKIISLHPYLGNDNLLRVGGRLEQSHLHYNTKHPILLPKDHVITRLIIQEAHHSTLHGGSQLVLNQIRQHYWIING